MNNKYSLISIIIPVYNTQNYVQRAIESAVNQSYPNIEIIVVNDGSIDNSGKVIQNMGKKYKNIKYFSQTNRDVSSARNRGLDNMEGEYFFLDSDDWLEADAIEYLYTLLSNSRSEISACSYNLIKTLTKRNINDRER